ncbi:GRM4-like protein [Mya arenaria]|uniref:GRM4-like protein n=1 Tax=Mya arenaria TaxID=6604 RepID=A0ABY7DL77_MYAAR|nr:GRM4-like protein [Mya arenaria]
MRIERRLPRAGPGLTLLLVVFLAFGPAASFCQENGTSSFRSWTRSGTLVLRVLAAIHEPDGVGGCSGRLSTAVIEHLVALDFVAGVLAKNGVDLGYEIFDTCSSEAHIAALLVPGFPSTTCQPDARTNTIGTLVLVDVEGGRLAGRLVRGMPVFRPLPAAIQSVSDPILIHTVVPMEQELKALDYNNLFNIQAILSLLKNADWNFVAEVHSTDEYGMSASARFQALARSASVCLTMSVAAGHEALDRIYSFARKEAVDTTLTVVYFGNSETFIAMLNSTSPSAGITWLVTSAIHESIKSKFHREHGEVSVVHVDHPFYGNKTNQNWHFYSYFQNIRNGFELSPISDLVSQLPSNHLLELEPKHVLDAVLAGALAANDTLHVSCGELDIKQCLATNSSIVESLTETILSNTVNVTEFFKDLEFYPYASKEISFNKNGFQNYSFLRLSMSTYDKANGVEEIYTHVWEADADADHCTLTLGDPRTLPVSACRKHCEKCVHVDEGRFSYLHGEEALIVGLFTIRNYDKRLILTDFTTGHVVDADRVVAVVGSLSSPVTILIGDIVNAANLPLVSYSASSMELDNRIRYPYFLRTVPSDPVQIHGMIQLVVQLEVNHVGLVYIDDAYGINGKEGLLNEAKLKNICIRDPISISQDMTTSQLDKVINKLFTQQVRVVLYFGIDTLARRLLLTFKDNDNQGKPLIFIASDGWGTNRELVAAEVEKASLGALVFTVSAKEFQNRFRNGARCEKETMTTYLNDSLVGNLVKDQRGVHTGLAVQAVASGYKQFCTERQIRSIPCYQAARTSPTDLVNSIRRQSISGKRLFDESGNGNIGFTIHNIQLDADGRAFYKEVRLHIGSFGTDGRLTLTSNPKFYNNHRKNVSLQDPKEEFYYYTRCANYLSTNECDPMICVVPINSTVTTAGTVTSTSAPPTPMPVQSSQTMEVIVVILGALLAVFAIILVLISAFLCRFYRPPAPTKAISDEELDVYDSPSSVTRTFGNLAFDMDSLTGRQHSQSGSVIGSASADSQVQYADIRGQSHLSDSDLLRLHALSSMERPSSVASAPVSRLHKISKTPALQKYKTMDLVGKPGKYKQSPGAPRSAPMGSTTMPVYRSRADSSPRFRCPSWDKDDPHYIYPNDSQLKRAVQTRHNAVSDDDLSDSPDTQVEERSDPRNQESQIQYLSARDLQGGSSDEEDAAEEGESQNTERTGDAPSGVGPTSNKRITSSSSTVITSPNDLEIININFPYNKRHVPVDMKCHGSDNQFTGKSDKSGTRAHVPDIINSVHSPYQHGIEEDGVFMI